jgi:hypothetical protein
LPRNIGLFSLGFHCWKSSCGGDHPFGKTLASPESVKMLTTTRKSRLKKGGRGAGCPAGENSKTPMERQLNTTIMGIMRKRRIMLTLLGFMHNRVGLFHVSQT